MTLLKTFLATSLLALSSLAQASTFYSCNPAEGFTGGEGYTLNGDLCEKGLVDSYEVRDHAWTNIISSVSRPPNYVPGIPVPLLEHTYSAPVNEASCPENYSLSIHEELIYPNADMSSVRALYSDGVFPVLFQGPVFMVNGNNRYPLSTVMEADGSDLVANIDGPLNGTYMADKSWDYTSGTANIYKVYYQCEIDNYETVPAKLVDPTTDLSCNPEDGFTGGDGYVLVGGQCEKYSYNDYEKPLIIEDVAYFNGSNGYVNAKANTCGDDSKTGVRLEELHPVGIQQVMGPDYRQWADHSNATSLFQTTNWISPDSGLFMAIGVDYIMGPDVHESTLTSSSIEVIDGEEYYLPSTYHSFAYYDGSKPYFGAILKKGDYVATSSDVDFYEVGLYQAHLQCRETVIEDTKPAIPLTNQYTCNAARGFTGEADTYLEGALCKRTDIFGDYELPLLVETDRWVASNTYHQRIARNSCDAGHTEVDVRTQLLASNVYKEATPGMTMYHSQEIIASGDINDYVTLPNTITDGYQSSLNAEVGEAALTSLGNLTEEINGKTYTLGRMIRALSYYPSDYINRIFIKKDLKATYDWGSSIITSYSYDKYEAYIHCQDIRHHSEAAHLLNAPPVAAAPSNAWVNASNEATAVCSATDSTGTIVAYEWFTPVGILTLTNATSETVTISAGEHEYPLDNLSMQLSCRAQDSFGAWSEWSDGTINVNSRPVSSMSFSTP